MKNIIFIFIISSCLSVANALNIPVPEMKPGGFGLNAYNATRNAALNQRRQHLENQYYAHNMQSEIANRNASTQRQYIENEYYLQEEQEKLKILRYQRKLLEMQIKAMRSNSAKNESPSYTGALSLFTTEMAAQNHCPNDLVVWLNLPTGIWHYKGARWYGNTKHGSYVCREEASAAGDRGSYNGQ